MTLLISIAIGLVLVELILCIFLWKVRFVHPPEFPPISAKAIQEYASFDPELGWVRQPNESKEEKHGLLPSSWSTDSLGSRTNRTTYDDASILSTYGDSFCFCREVNDDETWQHFLSERLRTRVTNYGVGNYGFDQSLWRLQRQFDRNPTRTVIISVTPWNIMRILSIWKHFSEFGNTLAAKPRYELAGDDLKYVSSVVKTREDFGRMRDFAEDLRKSDGHRYTYFQDHQVPFPKTITLFRNRRVLAKVLSSTLMGAFIALGLAGVLNRLHWKLHYGRSLYELDYKKRLFEAHGALFVRIAREFRAFSEQKGFRPMLLMIPAYEDILYRKRHGNYYADVLKRCANVEGLTTIDMMEDFCAYDDPGTLFTATRNRFPGHINASGNRLIADRVHEQLTANE